jgi:hypothetical protein
MKSSSPFTNSMFVRRPPLSLSGMALAILDGIEPSKYRESLETSLEISILSSPDLRKQIAIIRETLHRRPANIFCNDCATPDDGQSHSG